LELKSGINNKVIGLGILSSYKGKEWKRRFLAEMEVAFGIAVWNGDFTFKIYLLMKSKR